MSEQNSAASASVNRAKPYQLMLFPLNNGATNVYYVLVLSYIATFGSKVLALSMIFASVMVTGMRLFDAITDPIIGALMDRTNGKFGKFRPFMVIGNLIMAVSILVLYGLTPLIPASMEWARYVAFVALYAIWVIGYTFQTSCTRSGQTVLTNDPKQRPLFTIFNTVGSLLGMGAMQFFAPILAKNYEGGYASAGFFRTLAPVGIVISIALTILAVIGIWEKDQPKYFGIGGQKTEKIKVAEYVAIIKGNNPMQRLMVAGAGCKLALSIATNTTVLCMLYGCMMGNYDGLYLPMMAVQGVDGHFGLDFKAAAQHRVGFDKLVAERTVARHDILDLAAEEVVGKKPHQVVAKIVERAFLLGVIGGGKPIPHHHISLVFGNGFDHFRGRFRRVGIVAVHHDIGFGVNFAEHAADDVAFALLVFVAHHGTGCAGQVCRAIGRVVIVHIDRSFRQNAAEIHHNLLYCLRFVITGDKNCYFIQ